ncbi:MAG TPA: hypothetical protein VFP34_15025 [Microlunatus sp.]|nr:hypothetical protein [Microlunatus sp.]
MSPPPIVPHRRPPVLDAAQTALIPLRPLSIGEILDGGFTVVRCNARMMVGLPLVVAGGTAIYLLLGLGLYLVLGNTTARWAQILLTVLVGLLGVFLLVQCLVWMTAVLSRVSLQTVLGDGFAPNSSRASLRGSLPMFWPVLGLSLLQYVAASVVQTVLGILYYVVLIPIAILGSQGSAGFVASVVISLATFGLTGLAYGYLALTVPALATEGRTAPVWIGKPAKPTTVFSAFERAFALIGLSNSVRVALVMAGAMAISLALIGLLAAGLLAIIVLFATSIGRTAAAVVTNPWTVGGVITVSAVIAMSALLAYVAAVQTLLYLDLRMRREGLDLALRFDVVPVPQPVPQPAAPPAPMVAVPGPPTGPPTGRRVRSPMTHPPAGRR